MLQSTHKKTNKVVPPETPNFLWGLKAIAFGFAGKKARDEEFSVYSEKLKELSTFNAPLNTEGDSYEPENGLRGVKILDDDILNQPIDSIHARHSHLIPSTPAKQTAFSSPVKSGNVLGILKTPGTVSKTKNVSFAPSIDLSSQASVGSVSSNVSDPSRPQSKIERIRSGLPASFPGKFPSPWTPRVVSMEEVDEEEEAKEQVDDNSASNETYSIKGKTTKKEPERGGKSDAEISPRVLDVLTAVNDNNLLLEKLVGSESPRNLISDSMVARTSHESQNSIQNDYEQRLKDAESRCKAAMTVTHKVNKELTELRKTIFRQEDEIIELKHQKESLEGKLKRHSKPTDSNTETGLQDLENAYDTIESLERHRHEQETVIEKLKIKIDSLENKPVSTNGGGLSKDKDQTVQDLNRKLEQKDLLLSESNNNYYKTLTELESLEKENDKLRAELEKLHQAEYKESSNLQSHGHGHNSLLAKVESQQIIKDHHEESIRTLTNQLQEKNILLQSLQDKQTALLEQLRKSEAQSSSSQREAEKVKNHIQQQLDSKIQLIESLSTKIEHDRSNFSAESAAQAKIIENLQTDLRNRYSDLEHKLFADTNKASKKLIDQENQFNIFKQSAEKLEDDLRKQISNLVAENAFLSSQNNMLHLRASTNANSTMDQSSHTPLTSPPLQPLPNMPQISTIPSLLDMNSDSTAFKIYAERQEKITPQVVREISKENLAKYSPLRPLNSNTIPIMSSGQPFSSDTFKDTSKQSIQLHSIRDITMRDASYDSSNSSRSHSSINLDPLRKSAAEQRLNARRLRRQQSILE